MSQQFIRRSLCFLATACFISLSAPAIAQQPPNEIDQIKSDVAELQKLVREIEGRLYLLQQRLNKLPKTMPNTAIDKNAALLKKIFNELNALRSDGALKQVKINVTVTTSGVIVLKGEVANQEQMKKVLETVRKVPGVKSIVNEIKVSNAADLNKSTTMFFDGDSTANPFYIGSHKR